jgi:regulator of sirC expression with transglutaminase-like and TPR domain
MQQEISERFNALASRAETMQGLAEGALILASEAKPDVDIEAGLSALSELADRARPLVENATHGSARVEALNHSLFELERFRGNQEQFDDPRNSFLDDVLTRRIGLPITLSVLYVEVARQLGFEAYGIGFPGHFLAKVVGMPDSPGGEVIVDPFFGRVLRPEDCAERLRAAAGDDVSFDPQWLRPATSHEIYVRMLNNLKLHYLRRGDGLGALGCFDRILVLAPEAASEYRDRGLLLERLDCVLPAIEDLTRYLELAPRDENAAAIRARRNALAQRKPVLN